MHTVQHHHTDSAKVIMDTSGATSWIDIESRHDGTDEDIGERVKTTFFAHPSTKAATMTLLREIAMSALAAYKANGGVIEALDGELSPDAIQLSHGEA